MRYVRLVSTIAGLVFIGALLATAFPRVTIGAPSYPYGVEISGVAVSQQWPVENGAVMITTSAGGNAIPPQTMASRGANAVIASGEQSQVGDVCAIEGIDAGAGSATGVVLFTDSGGNERTFHAGESATMTLWDEDLNLNVAQVDQSSVTVSSNTQIDPETVTLTETGTDTGVFEGSIPFDEVSGTGELDGDLDVSVGDNLLVSYDDAADEWGNPAVAEDEAVYVGSNAWSGHISEDTTWTAANSPYIIIGNMTVDGGSTLTVEPGVEVRFFAGNSLSLGIDGSLLAQGTATNPVIFTSTAATPQPGDWGEISSYSGMVELTYCEARYATYGIMVSGGNLTDCLVEHCLYSGISTYDDSMILRTTVQYCGASGWGAIEVGGGSPVIRECGIRDNLGGGLSVYSAASPLIEDCSVIDNNGDYAIYVAKDWWSFDVPPGEIRGCTLSGSNYGLWYETQGGDCLTDPLVVEDCAISGETCGVYIQATGSCPDNSPVRLSGCDLSGSGVYAVRNDTNYDTNFRFNYWGVDATTEMDAGGNPKDITAIYDLHDISTYGLVKYSGWLDAPGGIPAPHATTGVVLFTDSEGSEIESFTTDQAAITLWDTDLITAGGVVEQATVSVTSPLQTETEVVTLTETGTDTGVFEGSIPFDEVSGTGELDGDLDVSVGDNLLVSYDDAADEWGNPAVAEDEAVYVGSNAWSGHISEDTTWTAANSPYIIIGNMTVDGGSTLTVEPGVEVRFFAGNSLSLGIDGSLLAQGTATNPVIFTSTAATPQPGDWGEISSYSGMVELTYCEARYATYGIMVSGGNLTDCLVEHCLYSGISTYDDSMILRTTVQYCGASGWGAIEVGGGSPVIRECGIRDNLGGGLSVYSAASPLIEDCSVIDNNGDYAIYVAKDWWSFDVPPGEIRGCTLSGSNYGLWYETQGGDCLTDPLVVEDCAISGETCGVYIQATGSCPDNSPVRLSGCDLSGSGVYAVRNDTNYDTNFRFNYWGVDATTEMDAGGNPKDITAIYDLHDISTYGLVKYSGWLDAPGGIPAPHATTGVVLFTDSEGSEIESFTTDQAAITLWDTDLITAGGVVEQATVSVTSPLQTETEVVTLTETGTDTGVFEGSIPFDEVSGTGELDGDLDVSVGDNLLVSYDDAADEWGNPAVAEDEAVYVGSNAWSGHISEDTTWTAANSPYIIIGNMTVDGGSTLTVEPGVEVRFFAGNSLSLGIDGSLLAQGTATNPVIFTSTAATPQPGDWGEISSYSGMVELTYCEARYATYGIMVSGGNLTDCLVEHCLYSGISTYDDSMILRTTVQYCGASGWGAIEVGGGSPVIRECGIRDNLGGGLSVYSAASPLIEDCSVIDNNGDYAIYVAKDWWSFDVPPGEIRGCTLSGSNYGLWYETQGGDCLTDPLVVEDCAISGETCGVYIQATGSCPDNSPVRLSGCDLSGSGVYAVRNDTNYDTNFRFNYWGVDATTEMDAGGNPKDITAIYDLHDISTYGFVNYRGWLSDPANMQPCVWPVIATVAGGASVVIALDGTDPNEDILTYSIDTPPAHGTVELAGDTVTYTADTLYIGYDGFTYTASDGLSTSQPATVRLEVLPGDLAPALDPIGDKEGRETYELAFSVTASAPEGYTPSLAVTRGLPDGAGLVDHGDGTGTFTWTPTPDQGGEYRVTFAAVLGYLRDEETITILILERNPQILENTPCGWMQDEVGGLRFRFDQPMDGTSFSLAEDVVSFTGPLGDLPVNGYGWISPDTLEITFDPQREAGEYEMIIGPEIMDVAGNPMDQDHDLIQNEVPDDQYVGTFTLAPDLVVTHVSVPIAVHTGDPVEVSWIVKNRSVADTPAVDWTDAVYLVEDAGWWSPGDVPNDTLEHAGPLGAESVYNASLQIDTTGMADGTYYVIVQTDQTGVVDEGPVEDNNHRQATQTQQVGIPELTLGHAMPDTMDAAQAPVYYCVNADSGNHLFVTLVDGNGIGHNELYVKYGGLPTRDNYDERYREALAADQQVQIIDTQAGLYYIMVYGDWVPDAPGDFNLVASYVDFSIFTITPDYGGNAGNVTVRVEGAHFPEGSTVQLTSNGGTILEATEIAWVTEQVIYATFDLTGLDPGIYDLTVTTVPGPSVTMTDTFIVQEVPAGASDEEDTGLRADLIAPSAMRVSAQGSMSVEVANEGANDVSVPQVWLVLPEGMQASLDSFETLEESNMMLIDIQPEGCPFAILPPGTTVRVPVYYKAPPIPGPAPMGLLVPLNAVSFEPADPETVYVCTECSINQQDPSNLTWPWTGNAGDYKVTMYLDGHHQRITSHNTGFFEDPLKNEFRASWDPQYPGYPTTTAAPTFFVWYGTRVLNGNIVPYAGAGLEILDLSWWIQTVLGTYSWTPPPSNHWNTNGPVVDPSFGEKDDAPFYLPAYKSTTSGTITMPAYPFDDCPSVPYDKVALDSISAATRYNRSAVVVYNFSAEVHPATWSGTKTAPKEPVQVGDAGWEWRYTVRAEAVPKNPPPVSGGGGPTTVVGSFDPNEKVPPPGFGTQGFVPDNPTLPYTIYFENDPELATAPAQVVGVMDELDSDLDLSTFELTEIAFGDHIITVPSALTHYSTTVDLRPEGTDLLVEIKAGLDSSTGAASWSFNSLDPDTLDTPDDPFAGFLPVNDETHRGEGHVSYIVRPKANLAGGTDIRNSASIVFDINEPISTNEVLNTIDAVAPSSEVNPLPDVMSGDSVPVSWVGEDDENGSGIASYDIYVSDNGGPFNLWIASATPTQTADTFVGEHGHTYAFYSIATDNVGHREKSAAEPDATTMLSLPSTATVNVFLSLQGSSRPEPEGWEVPLTIALFEPGTDVVTAIPIHTFSGTTTYNSGSGTAVCEISDIDPGTYDITVVSDHTLMNVKRNVVITAPSTAVDMGTLLEGDWNGNLSIDWEDLGTVLLTYDKCEGDEGFDPAADFNRNGCIDWEDLGLVLINYDKTSPVEVP